MKRPFLTYAVTLLFFVTQLCIAADRPIILVTPAGVYQSVAKNGIPGPWVAFDADVIVQGFNNTPDDPNDPNDPNDPIPDPSYAALDAVADLSKETLQKDDAVALSVMIETLIPYELNAVDFAESLGTASRIIDASVGADKRIENWVPAALKITQDYLVTADRIPTLLRDGLNKAFSLKLSDVRSIAVAVNSGADPATVNVSPEIMEALDLVKLIQIIQMIIELLRNLGIFKTEEERAAERAERAE